MDNHLLHTVICKCTHFPYTLENVQKQNMIVLISGLPTLGTELGFILWDPQRITGTKPYFTSSRKQQEVQKLCFIALMFRVKALRTGIFHA